MDFIDLIQIQSNQFRIENYVESWLHLNGCGKNYLITGSNIDVQDDKAKPLDVVINIFKGLSYVAFFPITCTALIYRQIKRKNICDSKQIDKQFRSVFSNKIAPLAQNIDKLKQQDSQLSAEFVDGQQSFSKPMQPMKNQSLVLPSVSPTSTVGGTHPNTPFISNWIIVGEQKYSTNSNSRWTEYVKDELRKNIPGKILDDLPASSIKDAAGILVVYCSSRFAHDDPNVANSLDKLKQVTGREPILIVIDSKEERILDLDDIANLFKINKKNIVCFKGAEKFSCMPDVPIELSIENTAITSFVKKTKEIYRVV